MNLMQFLKQVDQIASPLSKNELLSFIHEIARTLPEVQRDAFLNKLLALSDNVVQTDSLSHAKNLTIENLRQNLAKLEKELSRIDQGDLCFSSSLNEEYDDWYNSSDEEYFFEDPDGIAEQLEMGCRLIHQCIDAELYPEGYELFERITGLTITVDGDYADDVMAELSFYEAIETMNLDIHEEELILDGLYAAYRSTPPKQRPKALFAILSEADNRKITLEVLMQRGEKDLPDWEAFLDDWTAYLSRQDSKLAELRLKEAFELQNDFQKLLHTAQTCAKDHPELYEQYLTRGLENTSAAAASTKSASDSHCPTSEELLTVGKAALTSVPVQYTLRSRIALLTAVCALRQHQPKTAENCWLEAFRSDTSVVNYLRLRLESSDFSLHQQQTAQILREAKSTIKAPYTFSKERHTLNQIEKNTYYALAFFQGDFQQVIQEGMNETSSLGWSATFMKYGISLFLLYLYSGDKLPAGCQAMCERAVSESGFHTEAYEQGLERSSALPSTARFWQCICQWKTGISLSADEKEKLVQKLEQWIALRVQGIMEANRRNYYGECAAFIAALGEVKESLGEVNGKARFMDYYKTSYSRRSAFHGELRKFGMRK